jgi:hypothetical protein
VEADTAAPYVAGLKKMIHHWNSDSVQNVTETLNTATITFSPTPM